MLYISPQGSGLLSYSFDTNSQLFNTGASAIGSHLFNWPGSTPSVSAMGTSNGIVWSIDATSYCTAYSTKCGPAVLVAVDAGNVATELWNSSQSSADAAGNSVKFTVPTIANGRVYIGTRGNDSGAGTSSILGELDVYGLKPN